MVSTRSTRENKHGRVAAEDAGPLDPDRCADEDCEDVTESPSGGDEAQARPKTRSKKGVKGLSNRADEEGFYDEAAREAIMEDGERGLQEAKGRMKSRPSIEKSEKDSLLGPAVPIIDDLWTPDVEAEVQAQWKSSLLFKNLEEISSKTGLLELFKDCMRLFGCSPFAIVSPANGLYSVCKTLDGKFPESPNPVWSHGFCESLNALVTHSLWRGSGGKDMVVAMLQFAVICRTDDRRGWALDWPTDSLVLSDLSRQVAQGPLEKSVHDIHLGIRKESKGLPSLESSLLKTLGSSIKPDKEAVLRHEDGLPCYWVQIEEIKAILQAIDQCHGVALNFFPGTKSCAKSYTAARGNQGVPAKKDLGDFIKQSYIHQLRLLKQRKLQAFLEEREIRPDTSRFEEREANYDFDNTGGSEHGFEYHGHTPGPQSKGNELGVSNKEPSDDFIPAAETGNDTGPSQVQGGESRDDTLVCEKPALEQEEPTLSTQYSLGLPPAGWMEGNGWENRTNHIIHDLEHPDQYSGDLKIVRAVNTDDRWFRRAR